MSEVTRTRSGSSTRTSRRTTRSKGVNNMYFGNNDIDEETKEVEKACVQPDAIPSSISSRSGASAPAASTGSTTRQSAQTPAPAAFVEKGFLSSDQEVPVARKPRKQSPREIKHDEDIRPCSVSSGSNSSSMAAISTHHRYSNSNEEKKKTAGAPTPAPVAFVEKDFIKQEPEAEEEEEEETTERAAKTAPLPETINSSDTTTSKQPTTKEYYNDDNSNNIEGVAIKNEESLADSNTNNNQQQRRKQGGPTNPIKTEPFDSNNNDISQMNTRRSNRRKRKPPHSSSILTQACDSDDDDSTSPDYSLQTNNHRKKRQRKNNQGEPVVASSTNRRTSPRRNKKHQHQNDTIISSTGNNDNDNSTVLNCCKLCNDPYWESKIYYKCGTVISKYFPKSNNNPNPGWYKGTIWMHHVSSSSSGSRSDSDSASEYEYEDEPGSISEVKRSERQQIIFLNEIHYDDGDTENITQDHLKLQVVGGRKVKILHPTKMTTTSNSERHNRVVDVAPTTTSSDNQHDRKWFAMYGRLQQFKADNGHCRVPWNYSPDPSLANWVKMQRKTYKQRKLGEDRVEKLDDIGFEWAIVTETPDQAWQEKYERLKQFKAKNGHCRVPTIYGSDPSFGIWISRQRKFYNKGTLAEDRTEKLNKIGFDWDAFDQTWQEKYDRLKTYKEENGHCRVPHKYDPDPSLGFWVINQRRQAFYKQLAEDRAEKLNKIGFDWDLDDRKWDEMFGRLEQFKAKSGHCLVPRNYRPDPPLSLWVTNQRKKYKKGIMSNDRVEKLNKISFDWDVFDQTWDAMFGKLEKFKEENGHCRVPPRYGSHPSLGNWVSNQRHNYKKGTLAPDRAEKLEEIGFDWDLDDWKWDEMFGRLEQFKIENSHCRVPQRYGPDPSLGSWVSTQRSDYKKGKLAKDRVRKLEDISFDWSPPNPRNRA